MEAVQKEKKTQIDRLSVLYEHTLFLSLVGWFEGEM
jgi:hypothetical protein